MRLDELVDAALASPTLSMVVGETKELLDLPFKQKLPPTLSQIVSELSLESFIDKAMVLRQRKYDAQHFTLLTANTLIEEITKTETASKLVSEFWTSGGEQYE